MQHDNISREQETYQMTLKMFKSKNCERFDRELGNTAEISFSKFLAQAFGWVGAGKE